MNETRVLWSMGSVIATVMLCIAVGCGYGAAPAKVSVPRQATAAATPSLGPTVLTLAAAGDIACDKPASVSGCRGADTAAQIQRMAPGLVLALGDLVYDSGSLDQFKAGYEPTWGKFKSKTFPVPGNHEYGTSGAAGYKTWWGATAMPTGTTWHAQKKAGWLFLGLDSNCGSVGGCGATSPQGRWLAAQLKTAPKCTVAIWHHPRRSSGPHGDNASVQPLWAMLQRAGVEAVLNGHDHDYERFTTLDANANPAASGMREFVVGTGGKTFYPLGQKKPGSVASVQGMAGVLRLDLHAAGYGWKFITSDGVTRDSGSSSCN